MTGPVPAAGGATMTVGRQCSALQPPLEPLAGIDIDGEAIGDPFVRDQHCAVCGPQRPQGPESTDRVAHVVDGLKGADEIEGPGQVRIGGVAHFETDPISEPSGSWLTRACAMDASSRSRPTTLTWGKPAAIAMQDHPDPQP